METGPSSIRVKGMFTVCHTWETLLEERGELGLDQRSPLLCGEGLRDNEVERLVI